MVRGPPSQICQLKHVFLLLIGGALIMFLVQSYTYTETKRIIPQHRSFWHSYKYDPFLPDKIVKNERERLRFSELLKTWPKEKPYIHTETITIIPQHRSVLHSYKYDPFLLDKIVKNERERLRFSELLKTWPKDKPKAAIYFLLSNRYMFINRSLTTLHTYFNAHYQYPIIIFHERNYKASKVIQISKNLSSDLVFFQEVELKVPNFFKSPVPYSIPCMRSMGYRHMCRFNARGFSEQPIMQELDYVWRLDDDSSLLDNVTYDVFKYMHDNQFLYGYNFIDEDSPKCVHDLWKSVREFAVREKLPMQSLNAWPENKMYYNNFEISAMSIWRSKNYMEYIDYIDRLGGIYWYRWGDAPIKTLAVVMFIPEKRRHHFKDIGYHHNIFTNIPRKNQYIVLSVTHNW